MIEAGVYHTNSPVLFILFNRPDTTKRVFAEIRNARPAKLYIAADGPRLHKPGEQELCEQTRTIVTDIDWPCQVFTLFNNVNKGCKNAVSDAITWFFANEEEGIILEDDCLPHNSFFSFCDEMLERYRHDMRVGHICGCNFQGGKLWGDAGYYFSNLTHVWGWAGWRRVWKNYDKELTNYHEADVEHYLKMVFAEPLINESWLNIFKALKAGKIDTWDYQLTFLNFFTHSLSVIPNHNLISNIGFGASATHTIAENAPNANLPLVGMASQVKHPLFVLPQKEAGLFTLNIDFDVPQRKRQQKNLKNRLKRGIKHLLTKKKASS